MNSDLERSLVARRGGSVVVSERFGSETLVLNVQSDLYVRLNKSGSRLWEALDGPVRPEDLASILVAEWGLSGERALQDALAFLKSLADRELIEFKQP